VVKTQESKTFGGLNCSLRLNEALTEVRKVSPSSTVKLRFNVFEQGALMTSKTG